MSWRSIWERYLSWLRYWFMRFSLTMWAQEIAPDPWGSPQTTPLPPRPSSPAPVVMGDHTCAVCGSMLPEGTARTHDGHWRCAAHKGVTCDVCGRGLPPVNLVDQPWTCGLH